jgi:hypothetical protein
MFALSTDARCTLINASPNLATQHVKFSNLKMGMLSDSTVARYVRAIKQSPREIIFSRRLLVSAALYATAGVPISMQ